MRLIDADKMKKDLEMGDDCNTCSENWKSCQYDRIYSKMDFCGCIDDQPTVEPEQKKGKWIPVDSYTAFGGDKVTWMAHGNPIAFYYCSECGSHAYAGEDGEDLLTKFCPDCGADMRGGKK